MSIDVIHQIKAEDWTLERALRRIADLEENCRKACEMNELYRIENLDLRRQMAQFVKVVEDLREALYRTAVGDEEDEFLR